MIRPTVAAEQTAADLTAALALIADPECWAKGDRLAEVPPGKTCVGMAIRDACPTEPRKDAALNALYEQIGWHDLFRWHDAPGTTHWHVVDVMRSAIAAQEAAS